MEPTESRVVDSGTAPSRGMRSAVGLKPTSPQNAAGMRHDPPVSVPRAACAIRSDTDTAPPDVEPPAIRASPRFQGDSGVPKCGLRPSPENANSLMLVRPIRTKPARRRRSTAGASAGAGAGSRTLEPARVTCPCTSNRSLIEIGMPAKRDGAALAARRTSIASAARLAPSRSTCRNATPPCPAASSIRARQSSTTARLVIRPAARSAARLSSVGPVGCASPLMAGVLSRLTPRVTGPCCA